MISLHDLKYDLATDLISVEIEATINYSEHDIFVSLSLGTASSTVRSKYLIVCFGTIEDLHLYKLFGKFNGNERISFEVKRKDV